MQFLQSKIPVLESSSNSFIEHIQVLEDQKLDLIMQGAGCIPELAIRFEMIDRKLKNTIAGTLTL